MKMFYQQFLAFFLMITITLLTLGMTFLGLSRSMFYQNTWDRLQDYAYAVKTQAMDIEQGNDSKVVVDKKKLVITEQMLSGRHIKIRIYTEPDKLIFPDSKKATTKISSQCWAKLKRGQSVRAKTSDSQGFFKDSNRQLTNIYEPYLDIKGNLMAVVSVGTVMNGIEEDLSEIKQNLLYAFFTAVVLGTIVSFVLTHYFTNRITKIQRATRQVANGDFDVQIDTYHHDELDDLAEDFNLMTRSLKESQVEIERQEQRRHELMANAAHEMRTPLTTINGLLEGMAYGALPEEDQEQCINLMRKETTRLIRLVNENLDYEKSRSGELVLAKTNFDATSAIKDVVSQLHKMAGDVGDRFIVKLPPLLNVYADKDRFIQIITNIGKNAVQFTRDGTITISGEKHGNDTMISIADTGIGMTDEEVSNMWERYYKADPSRKVAKYGESGIGMASFTSFCSFTMPKYALTAHRAREQRLPCCFLARRLQAMAAISRKMTAASLLTDAIEILRQSLLIKRNVGQGSRFKTVIMPFEYTDEKKFTVCLEGIFSILISGNRLLLPNEVLRSACRISAPRQDYGQNGDFWNLPVKDSPRLRAKRRFLGFSRKRQPLVTGKTSISGICP